MKSNTYLKLINVALISIFSMSHVYAGVVMTGTRIIFPAQAKEKTIQLQNKDKYPNLVQIWLDSGDENSTPETANAPFVVNPQIFKIQPYQGQMIRLIFNGDASTLAQNQESLFYLNFSEIPAIQNSVADRNKLMVIFKNRIKVFYRPKNLSDKPEQLAQNLNYSFAQHGKRTAIKIQNNSSYYANISKIQLFVNDQLIDEKKSKMIAPKSSIEWSINQSLTTSNTQMKISLINDYGVSITHPIQKLN